MSELKKTLSIAGIAVLLGAVAIVSAPRRAAPDAFFDVGEPFFPEFTDPEEAATLEVIEFAEEQAAAIPFKVTNRNGLWTIPSHHDYPADGEERLANAAADVISVVKDDFRSDNVADHEALGVVDPTDETVSTLQGRGSRVTFRAADERVLADLVVGRPVPGRPGLRFVRAPGQKRVYAARFEADISTAFEDWIETNLLEVERDQVDRITLNEYFIDERTLSVVRRGEFVLDKEGADSWSANEVPAGQEVDTVQVNLLVGAVMTMKIAGVRPKPPGLSGNLREAFEQGQIRQSDVQDVDQPRLLSDGRGRPAVERGRAARPHERRRAVHAAVRRDRLRPRRRGCGGRRFERRRRHRQRREPLRLHHRRVRRVGAARAGCVGCRRACLVGEPG